MSSNRIAELRHKKNMTLKELGNALNMRDNTLSQYENNKREPKL
ncbi:helix-turn-helix transcriptional regulator, partial [Limosilactobacillus sp. BG-MG3-A]|nr:helix-turn-helix transcriptional regulator [Limosilactobacillus agrestis]